MKKTILWKAVASTLVGASLSFSVLAGSPIGKLDGVGVSVESPTGTINVNGQYAYFNGDRIRVGKSGDAKLMLGNDGSVEVGPESIATVDQAGGEYQVALEKGGMHFSFAKGIPFVIKAGDSQVRLVEGPSKVAAGGNVSGVVLIDENGKAVIHSMSGNLQVSSSMSGTAMQIQAGESVSMNEGKAKLISTKVSPPDDDNDNKAIWWWLLGGAGLVAIIDNQNDDDSNDSDNGNTTGDGDTGGSDTGGGSSTSSTSGGGSSTTVASGGGFRPVPTIPTAASPKK